MSVLIHPREGELNRFADNELPPRIRARVARHLESCVRCRTLVGDTTSLGAAARALATPAVPDGALDRILARRDRGDRVIVPTADPGARSTPRWRRWVLGAAAAVLMVVMWPAREPDRAPALRASQRPGPGTLAFAPAAARPGETVRVTYRPNGMFESLDRVVLRGTFISRGAPPCTPWVSRTRCAPVDVATLSREGASFHGTFVMPANALLGVFVVEDSAADEIDAGPAVRTRWWETQSWQVRRAMTDLMAADSSGRPSFDALRRRMDFWRAYNQSRAVETARLMTRLYPALAESWNRLAYAQERLYDRPLQDDVRRAYLPRFRQLDHALSARAALPVSEVVAMLRYADALGDTSAARRWLERAARDFSSDTLVVRHRAIDINTRFTADPARRLAEAERLWEEAPVPVADLLNVGFYTAQRLGDEAAVERWIARFPARRVIPDMMALRYPRLRDAAVARLRAQYEGSKRDTPVDTTRVRARPLGLSVSAWRERLAYEDTASRWPQWRRAQAAAAYGHALLVTGLTREALPVLEEAAGLVSVAHLGRRDDRLDRDLARAYLAVGDTARAIEPLAWSGPDELVDSVRGALGARFPAQRFERVRKEAADSGAAWAEESRRRSEAWKARNDSARKSLPPGN